MVEDFEEWYYKTYGKKVKVEYSCLGTNEELYNMLTLGDEYDLICPSEYMFMKLMAEGWLEPYSEQFYDKSIKENYYAKGVSPFIKKIFDDNKIMVSRGVSMRQVICGALQALYTILRK